MVLNRLSVGKLKSLIVLALVLFLFGCGTSSQTTIVTTGLDYRVDINTATISELMQFSGIGKIKANKIIKGRPYLNIYDLVEKKMIGQKVFNNIKEDLKVGFKRSNSSYQSNTKHDKCL